MKTFVGVDYHKAYSYGTILDESGKTLRHGRFDNTPAELGKFLAGYAGSDSLKWPGRMPWAG